MLCVSDDAYDAMCRLLQEHVDDGTFEYAVYEEAPGNAGDAGYNVGVVTVGYMNRLRLRKHLLHFAGSGFVGPWVFLDLGSDRSSRERPVRRMLSGAHPRDTLVEVDWRKDPDHPVSRRIPFESLR